jgi:hypothetical protein
MKLYAMKQDGLWVQWNWKRNHAVTSKALRHDPVADWASRLSPDSLVTLAERKQIDEALKNRLIGMPGAVWREFKLQESMLGNL